MSRYLMNPAEDEIIFGDELREGMVVFPENGGYWDDPHPYEFYRVTRLRILGKNDYRVTQFIGVHPDGYARVHEVSISHAWLVKKSSFPQEEE
jgi:hypothetical protein